MNFEDLGPILSPRARMLGAPAPIFVRSTSDEAYFVLFYFYEYLH